jgi:ribosome-binding factor A
MQEKLPMKYKSDSPAKSANKSGGKSVRLLRIGEEIRHILSGILSRGDIYDEILAKHSITVSEVRVSPDIRHATVFVKPLGGFDETEVLSAFKRSARFLKGEVGHKLRTRYIPELHFLIDGSFAEAEHIDKLLRQPKVKQDLA